MDHPASGNAVPVRGYRPDIVNGMGLAAAVREFGKDQLAVEMMPLQSRRDRWGAGRAEGVGLQRGAGDLSARITKLGFERCRRQVVVRIELGIHRVKIDTGPAAGKIGGFQRTTGGEAVTGPSPNRPSNLPFCWGARTTPRIARSSDSGIGVAPHSSRHIQASPP
ncbi:hypothetical protein D3C72_1482310 [compost metagenome]